MQIPDSLYKLVEKYLNGTASAEEQKKVNDWYHSFTDTTAEVVGQEGIEEAVIAARIKEKLVRNISTPAAVKPVNRWWLKSAAAAVLLLFSAGMYLFFSGKKTDVVTNNTHPSPVIKNDAGPVPGGNKATLTLADGSVIVLDSAANGLLGHQGGTKIIKLNNGQLAYDPSVSVAGVTLYNTIATPRGGQYQVTLPDSTLVWLNSSSSIRFPAIFTGRERTVEISGEAYFEVAKNAAMPFNVMVKGAAINVLGTHFNIMAYDNETSINTTLLEGSLKVTKGNAACLLIPGQQARLAENGVINLVKDADTDEAVAWKNGRFQFNSADIKTIMRQLERWYDVEVVFKNNTNLHLSGQVTRYAGISEVLRKLELTNEIHFTMEGKKVIVQ